MMRIVLFRIDKLGDMIVSTPVIGAIRAKNPDARIMMVASKYNADVVRGLPGVDEVILYREHATAAETAETLEKLRAFKATHSLVLSPKNECYFLALQAGIKVRGGLLMGYRWVPRLLAPILLQHSVFIPNSRKGGHQSTRLLKLAQKMGLAEPREYPYQVAQSASAEKKVAGLLNEAGVGEKFVALHLADKWVVENWGVEDVKYFIERIKQELNLPVIATAGPADVKLAAALEGIIPVLKNLSFYEWVAVLKASQAVVTPDCGAVHIACALQKPLLALYQPSRMARAVEEFGPMCTHYKARALDNPGETTNILLSDLRDLLKAAPYER